MQHNYYRRLSTCQPEYFETTDRQKMSMSVTSGYPTNCGSLLHIMIHHVALHYLVMQGAA